MQGSLGADIPYFIVYFCHLIWSPLYLGIPLLLPEIQAYPNNRGFFKISPEAILSNILLYK